MNKNFIYNISNLIENTYISFYHFLSIGISEKLSSLENPIIYQTKNSGKNTEIIYIYPNFLKFLYQNISINSCIKEELTLAAKIYVLSEFEQFYFKNTAFQDKYNVKKYFYICEIPIITLDGSFIINGCERIIINQLMRQVGIYFNQEYIDNKLQYFAILVSKNGFWTKFILSYQENNKYTFDISFSNSTENENKSKYFEENSKFFSNFLYKKLQKIEFLTDLFDFSHWLNNPKRFEKKYKNKSIYFYNKIFYKKFNSFFLYNKLIFFNLYFSRSLKIRKIILQIFIFSILLYDLLNKKKKIKSIFLKIKQKINWNIVNSFYKKNNNKNIEKKELIIEKSNLNLLLIIQFFGITVENFYDTLKYQNFLSLCYLNNFFSENFNFISFNSNNSNIDKFEDFVSKFYIGKDGRNHLNLNLNLDIPDTNVHLTIFDIVSILNKLFNTSYTKIEEDDFDNLNDKYLYSVGDFLLEEIQKNINNCNELNVSLGDTLNLSELNFNIYDNCNSNQEELLFDTKLNTFFQISDASQFLDQTNALSELMHKKKTNIIELGSNTESLPIVLRDLHPSFYTKFCSIDSPEGEKAGLISTISIFARISSSGTFDIPSLFLKNNNIFKNSDIGYISSIEDYNVYYDLSYGKTNTKYYSLEKVLKKDNSFDEVDQNKIEIKSISPFQIISIATGLIPFIEHDDSTRALMGATMQKQTLPLIYSQKAIIGTGLENVIGSNSQLVTKNISEGFILFSSSSKIVVSDINNQKIIYTLIKDISSNQSMLFVQKPIVWLGEHVFSNQVLADGLSINDGELSLGLNLLTAYFPWDGYNFEDAIIINERLLYEDLLTNIHIDIINSEISQYEVIEKIDHTENKEFLFNINSIDERGIIKLGAYVKEFEPLVLKYSCEIEEDFNQDTLASESKNNSSEKENLITKLIDNDLYNKDEEILLNNDDFINLFYSNTSTFAPIGTKGRVFKIFKGAYDFSFSNITIYLIQMQKIQVGDKLSGRHGNKGVISRILSEQDMPYMNDGASIDIILNPLGVPSRMNIGQIYESTLGLVADKLKTRFKIAPFDENIENYFSYNLVKNYKKTLYNIINKNWLDTFLNFGKFYLIDGRTGLFFDNPIFVGKSYILKLAHMVSKKVHGRSIGESDTLSGQPTQGKSLNGGQRLGEMEIWALQAYGCSYTIKEFLGVKSDDTFGKKKLYKSLRSKNSEPKYKDSISETFLILIRFLNSLGLIFNLNKVENNLNILTKTKIFEQKIFDDIESALRISQINQLSLEIKAESEQIEYAI